MDQNCILLPVTNLEMADNFYINVLSFESFEDYYKTSSKYGDKKILVLAQMIRGNENLPYERPALFRVFYKDDIVVFCQFLISESVDILNFSEYPGGYYMLIKDPFGNKIEIVSNFNEKSSSIDPSCWPFFNRL